VGRGANQTARRIRRIKILINPYEEEKRGYGDMSKVRVIQWGLGAMGCGMTKALMGREGIEIVGAISHQDGQDVGEAVGLKKKLGIRVSSEPDSVLNSVEADVLLLATHTFVAEVYPQIMAAIENNLNVITTAEEMLYPQVRFPDETKKMDEAAKINGVTILGTGINPGFVLDTLILALTGPCVRIDTIFASRVNDLSPFGTTVMPLQGVGMSPAEFESGVQSGAVVGHVGFIESVHMIADCLGWKIDDIKQERIPIVSSVVRETPYIRVQPGQTAGSKQTAYGWMNGRIVITLEHPQEVRPELEGTQVRDRIVIEGEPNIQMDIVPEIAGGVGTIGMVVNMIPHVISATPGVLTMKDLPIPYYWSAIHS